VTCRPTRWALRPRNCAWPISKTGSKSFRRNGKLAACGYAARRPGVSRGICRSG
jgi:exonuclease I